MIIKPIDCKMLVSIIIPCYNVNNYIEECLESVYCQTYQNLEVICVDNNSTDNTLEILEKLKETYNNLIILSEPKLGASAARNKGLVQAKGEWVQFLDADDLLLPSKIKHQLELLNENNFPVPFVAANTYLRNLEGKDREKEVEEDVWKALFYTKLGNTCANLFHKESLLSVGAWNEDLGSSQEYDLMFRLVKKFGAPIIDNKPLTVIRERESGQISQQNPIAKWVRYIELRKQMIEYLAQSKTAYFRANKDWYYQELFNAIRILYAFDSKKALGYFRSILPQHFKPSPSPLNSISYCILFGLLGFEKTERVKKLIKS